MNEIQNNLKQHIEKLRLNKIECIFLTKRSDIRKQYFIFKIDMQWSNYSRQSKLCGIP